MKDLSEIDDKTLVAELSRRKVIKRAKAWAKIHAVQRELFEILHDHELSDMKWGSVSQTIGEETGEFFESLWGACGGNDISKLVKE